MRASGEISAWARVGQGLRWGAILGALAGVAHTGALLLAVSGSATGWSLAVAGVIVGVDSVVVGAVVVGAGASLQAGVAAAWGERALALVSALLVGGCALGTQLPLDGGGLGEWSLRTQPALLLMGALLASALLSLHAGRPERSLPSWEPYPIQSGQRG